MFYEIYEMEVGCLCSVQFLGGLSDLTFNFMPTLWQLVAVKLLHPYRTRTHKFIHVHMHIHPQHCVAAHTRDSTSLSHK